MTRKLPLLNADTAPFWQGGSNGRLTMCHCSGCQRFFHPPAPICPQCMSSQVGPRAVSGKGTVVSFTVNHQAWTPTLVVPYVVAIVELVEQPGLRFVSNIVGILASDVHIDMPVKVTFEQVEDIWIPLFEPDTTGSAA